MAAAIFLERQGSLVRAYKALGVPGIYVLRKSFLYLANSASDCCKIKAGALISGEYEFYFFKSGDMMKIPVFLAFMLFVFSTAQADVLEDIRERQKGAKTVKAKFSQKKHTELLDRPIKSSGHFYFKSPVGVRWEYRDEMVVVYDGKTLFLHYTELEEAEKMDGVDSYAGPLVFDLGIILKDYIVDVTESEGTTRLDLKPKKHMPFKSMSMTFPKGSAFPGQVIIFEATGDYTVIDFHSVKTNVPLSDKLFKFSPPPGVIVKERKLP